MESDLISWLFFQNLNSTSKIESNPTGSIATDADISFASEVFTYEIIMTEKEGPEITFLENFSPIVVIDEVYRPGQGVTLRKDFYAIWREDIKLEKSQMLQLVKSKFSIKRDLDDLTISSQHKTHTNLKHNMLLTNNEKWERRKDLTGVVLKTVTNAVCLVLHYF